MGDRYAAYERLLIDRPAPRVLRVTTSNPARLNATERTMHDELARIWRDIDADPEVSAAILTGAGRRSARAAIST